MDLLARLWYDRLVPSCCPRCGGLAERRQIIAVDEDAHVLELTCCLNCGHYFNDPLLDYHHSLTIPPEPKRTHVWPVYDPTRKKITYHRERETPTADPGP